MAVVVLLCACTISGESDNATLVRPGGAGTPTGTSSSNTTAADGAAVTPGGDSAAGETSGGAASDTGGGEGSAGAGDAADTESSGSNESGEPGGTAAGGTAAGDPGGEGRDSDGDGGDGGDATPEETGGDASTGDGSGSGTGADTPTQTTTTTGPFTIAETAFDERSKVSTVGIGSVYFGMSPDEAASRARTAWDGIPAGGADCYVVTPTNGPPGVALWVYHGAIERVEIDTPLLRTQSGLGVGTTLTKLQDLLGEKLVVENHPSLRGWILATFVPTDPNDAAFRIAFDISDGKVARFRAGRTEIVALESCA